MTETLQIPTLVSCTDVRARTEGMMQILEMNFTTEDERQDYMVTVTVDPIIVLHGPSAVKMLFDQQREALPEASHAAWDDAVSKISVTA